LHSLDRNAKEKFLKNIDLTTEPFEVKIADLGFAKILKNDEDLVNSICGTPLYMNP
jgi:serine/threonine protein kinase